MAELAIRRLFTKGLERPHEPDIEVDTERALDREAPPSTPTGWRADRTLRLLSLIPFAVPVAELLFASAPSYFGGLTTAPPEIVGIPLALVLEVLFLTWAAIGAAIVWRTHSPRLAVAALFLFAPIATVGLFFRHALILLTQNLQV